MPYKSQELFVFQIWRNCPQKTRLFVTGVHSCSNITFVLSRYFRTAQTTAKMESDKMYGKLRNAFISRQIVSNHWKIYLRQPTTISATRMWGLRPQLLIHIWFLCVVKYPQLKQNFWFHQMGQNLDLFEFEVFYSFMLYLAFHFCGSSFRQFHSAKWSKILL